MNIAAQVKKRTPQQTQLTIMSCLVKCHICLSKLCRGPAKGRSVGVLSNIQRTCARKERTGWKDERHACQRYRLVKSHTAFRQPRLSDNLIMVNQRTEMSCASFQSTKTVPNHHTHLYTHKPGVRRFAKGAVLLQPLQAARLHRHIHRHSSLCKLLHYTGYIK